MLLLDVMDAALEADTLETSHALNPPEEEVQTLEEILDVFDVITYCKVQHPQLTFVK